MRSAALAFCALCLAAPTAPAGLASPSPDQLLVAGRLPCAEPWDGRASGWRQLAWELMKRTSVEAELETRPVDPASAELFRTPLLIWSCPGPLAELAEPAAANLRRFLQLGGFVWIDDPGAESDGAFERSVRALLARLLPDQPLAPIGRDHVLFKTFFLLEQTGGRGAEGRGLLGISLDGRLALVYSPGDILGAVARDAYGSWEQAVGPGGEDRREASFRLGINLIFYALCLDYKDDRVHLPFIRKRRRL